MRRVLSHLKSYRAKIIQGLLHAYFRKSVGNKKFSIFSNDCWGGEIYKILDRPYNTPFIGLMLMGPCYIKLLEDPKYYLSLTLMFLNESKYDEMQQIGAGTSFPVASLGKSGIEIQFLHYKSKEEAKSKWERRIERIDWQHLFVKYDCGKDYADKILVEKFLALPYSNKIIFGKEDFGIKEIAVLQNYSLDGVVQFRNCFLSLNPFRWLVGKETFLNNFQKVICRYAFKYI